MTRDPVQLDPEDFGEHEESSTFSWHQVQHLVHAPLRRPLAVVVPLVVVFLASVALLSVLPKKYRSSALILRESERVPASFVTKVTTEDSARISDIRSEILSRTRLERVIKETDPYPDIPSMTRAVDTMRFNTWVNSSGSDGFTLDFIHEDPAKAQEVASRLVTLFVEETIKAREQQVEDAVDFLVTQVKDARRELEDKDAALRRFKEEHMGRLPEQLQTNLTTMEMLQRETQGVEESLFLAREKRDALARSSGRAASPTRQQAGGASPDSQDLDALREQLLVLRSRYTDAHPDVESLRSRIARAEAKLAEAQRVESPDPPPSFDAAGALRRAQLQNAEQEVQKLEARQADLEKRIATMRSRVEETPRTEQELANLTRDYNKLSDNYTTLLSKQLDAQMAGRLEQRWKGDRYRVLDPPHLPEKPDSPRPKPILAGGLLGGLLAGLLLSVVLEVLDPTVKDARQLEGMLPFPVLARIPHLPGHAARH